MRDWPLKTEQRMNEPNVQGASISVEANEGDTLYRKHKVSKKLRAFQLFMRVSVQEPTLHESLILAQDERWRRA
jgi:hypothetical protein